MRADSPAEIPRTARHRLGGCPPSVTGGSSEWARAEHRERPGAPRRRALPALRRARQRRDGHRLVRLRRRAAAPRRGEGAEGPAGRARAGGPRPPRTHHAGGPGAGRAVAPQRHHGVRRRGRRRPAGRRPGAGPLPQPRDDDRRERRPHGRAGRGGRVRHGGRAARGAPRGHHPPRREAGQRPHRRRRPRQAHRLRHRPQLRRRAHDQRRPRARLTRVHRARGGGGPAGHARGRPVGARRHALRRRRGPPALRRARRPRRRRSPRSSTARCRGRAARARSSTSSPR